MTRRDANYVYLQLEATCDEPMLQPVPFVVAYSLFDHQAIWNAA